MTYEDEIKELKKRIEELEKRQVMPVYPAFIPNPDYYRQWSPVHYHNGTPCHYNPCTWC